MGSRSPRKPPSQRPLRVLVSGASGFIGTELCRQLEEQGHTVFRLVRGKPRTDSEFPWAPAAGTVSPNLIDAVDAVVNLSGASTGRIPWTHGYKKVILQSRVAPTRTLADAIARCSSPPAVLLNASAVGYYGDQPGVRLTEQSPMGDGFLAHVVERWEEAAAAASANTRVVNLRTGIVVGRGGAFTPLNLLTRFGLGARFGTGGQHWPWISLHDEAAAIRHLLTSGLAGPVNLVGPTPATSDRVTTALARAMQRWHPWVIPQSLIKLGLGEAGKTLLLTSQKVIPERLQADGFRFRDTTVEQAIAGMLATR